MQWALRAESGPFFGVTAGERLLFPNADLLMTMAMVACTTERLRLMTTVAILPLHPPGVVAKQVATLDVASKGRFSLGVGTGVSTRTEDFEFAPSDFPHRGEILDRQLALLNRIRRHQPVGEGLPSFDTSAAGFEILIGGSSPRALKRVAEFGDGLVTFNGDTDPDWHLEKYRLAETAWAERGRPGQPRRVAGTFFGLGPRAAEEATKHYFDGYFMYVPKARRAQMVGQMAATPESVRQTVDRFEGAGIDELFFSPTIPDIEQVDRLADAVT